MGSLLLALVPGIAGFAIGAVLIGVGTQIAPPTNSTLVAALAGPAQRAAALAAGRSLRNAGLGAGALLGTVLVREGAGGAPLAHAGDGARVRVRRRR